MRVAMPALALFAAWLATAPCVAFAQAGPSTAMQNASNEPANTSGKLPLAWSALSAGQQRMLVPLRGQWNQLQPARQHRLAERAQHWATLSPERRQQIRERLHHWATMTPGQRRQMHENARAFHDLPPAERAKVSEAYRKFQSLPPAERRALRERWRAMTPQQRMRWAAGDTDKPIPMHPPAASSDQ
jgi:hypothetical protein